MRLLTRCEACGRQYDVSREEAGTRFHCHCGEAVRVPTARSHDAAVILCSRCGGAREGDQGQCAFCGSDFTLHERDMHTICPGCMARISDRARFCHHCGLTITADQDAGVPTKKRCPVCEEHKQLWHRQLEEAEVAVLECHRCMGMWLGRGAFEHLLTLAARQTAPALSLPPAPARGPARTTQQRGPAYRRCVECGVHMLRQNYGRRSGIIVDVCREHGVWFDTSELEAILAWIRSGDAQRAVLAEQRTLDRKLQQQRMAETGTIAGGPFVVTSSADPDLAHWLIAGLAAIAARLAGLWRG